MDEVIAHDDQLRRVMGLRLSAFGESNPERRMLLLAELVQEEQKLGMSPPVRAVVSDVAATAGSGSLGNRLGAQTTGLEVSVTLCMNPLPSGILHVLDPKSDPVLRVKVSNRSRDRRRVRIRAGLESLSTQMVKTVELEREGAEQGAECTLSFVPTLLPGAIDHLNEIQRAALYVISEDLDGRVETHDTHTVVCLSRNSSFNSVRSGTDGSAVDLTHYYGAWVTPYDESVQERIRAAASLCTPKQIWGYQGKPNNVDRQVEALFQSLQQHGIKYVNSVIDFGAAAGYATQRTRLPRESLQLKSANCIDGTVLMASLIEGASLNPLLAIVPGHAFVGWETWRGSNQWRYLETTLMESTFEQACAAGAETYSAFAASGKVRTHSMTNLRRRGIWPMV